MRPFRSNDPKEIRIPTPAHHGSHCPTRGIQRLSAMLWMNKNPISKSWYNSGMIRSGLNSTVKVSPFFEYRSWCNQGPGVLPNFQLIDNIFLQQSSIEQTSPELRILTARSMRPQKAKLFVFLRHSSVLDRHSIIIIYYYTFRHFRGLSELGVKRL